MRYFEDFEPAEVIELGDYPISEQEILEFARAYDPQPFHVDASGWHTVAVFMRLWVDAILDGTAAMGSPGAEQIRWLVPVRAGDVLHGRVTIVEAAPSRTRADRGTLIMEGELLNQRDEVVMTIRGREFVARRDL